jgi:hypothetical protein
LERASYGCVKRRGIFRLGCLLIRGASSEYARVSDVVEVDIVGSIVPRVNWHVSNERGDAVIVMKPFVLEEVALGEELFLHFLRGMIGRWAVSSVGDSWNRVQGLKKSIVGVSKFI